MFLSEWNAICRKDASEIDIQPVEWDLISGSLILLLNHQRKTPAAYR